MNPYEVLGVRPTAGATEIELAFKGRRTQYHPDRYGGEPPATVNWATERMQEVNAAYALLSDPNKRQRYDRESRARPGSATEQPRGFQQEAAPTESPARDDKVSWREFLADSGLALISTSAVFFLNNIPQRKLEGALGSYGRGVNAAEVTLLLDDTFLGGAQRGMLATNQELRLKDRQGTWRLALHELKSVEGRGPAVYLNGHRTAVFQTSEVVVVACALSQLHSFVECSRTVAESAKEPDAAASVRRRIEAICRRYMGPEHFSGAASCSIGPEIRPGDLRIVRFCLGLPAEEELIAVSNLAIEGAAEAFAVTSRGLHSRVGPRRTFLSWSALRRMRVINEFQESIRCGVAFDDGTRIFCSRARSDDAIFGPALIRAIAATLELQ